MPNITYKATQIAWGDCHSITGQPFGECKPMAWVLSCHQPAMLIRLLSFSSKNPSSPKSFLASRNRTLGLFGLFFLFILAVTYTYRTFIQIFQKRTCFRKVELKTWTKFLLLQRAPRSWKWSGQTEPLSVRIWFIHQQPVRSVSYPSKEWKLKKRVKSATYDNGLKNPSGDALQHASALFCTYCLCF